MKIKIRDFIQCWNFIDKIYGMNDGYPPEFEAAMANNFRVFAPLIQQIKGREKELSEKEIDIPLSQLTVESLPDKLPPGTMNALKPILIDWEPVEFETTLEELLDGQKNEEPAAKDSD